MNFLCNLQVTISVSPEGSGYMPSGVDLVNKNFVTIIASEVCRHVLLWSIDKVSRNQNQCMFGPEIFSIHESTITKWTVVIV